MRRMPAAALAAHTARATTSYARRRDFARLPRCQQRGRGARRRAWRSATSSSCRRMRPGPRALPANARPRHRCSGADVPCALQRSEARNEVAAIRRGRDARWAHEPIANCGGGARRPHHHRLVGRDRQGVARWRAHHPGTRHGHRARMLPGGARFVSGADDGTIKLWTLDGALERISSRTHRVVRRGAARRRALCGRPQRRQGPAVPRRRHARPHLQGARRAR